MLSKIAESLPIYLVTEYTDMRKSIDGLTIIIQVSLLLDPFNKVIFLFCGKRCDRIKGLLWEGDGFLMVYKRVESYKNAKWIQK